MKHNHAWVLIVKSVEDAMIPYYQWHCGCGAIKVVRNVGLTEVLSLFESEDEFWAHNLLMIRESIIGERNICQLAKLLQEEGVNE